MESGDKPFGIVKNTELLAKMNKFTEYSATLTIELLVT
jgi:hypothetical protein